MCPKGHTICKILIKFIHPVSALATGRIITMAMDVCYLLLLCGCDLNFVSTDVMHESTGSHFIFQTASKMIKPLYVVLCCVFLFVALCVFCLFVVAVIFILAIYIFIELFALATL